MKKLLTLLFLIILPALSQANYDGPKGPYHDWYNQQKNSLGMVCCDDADGRPYEGDYEFLKDGSVKLDDGRTVPKAYVLTGPNPTGKAILWVWRGEIRCFIPGTLT